MSGNLRAVSEGRLRGGFVKELCAKKQTKNKQNLFYDGTVGFDFFEGMGPDMKENSDRS